MKQLSLICTIHEERGHANSEELYARLDRFKPEVIFLEAPSMDLNSFFREGARKKLEVAPVWRYHNETGAALIPVDLPTPEEKFFNDQRELTQRIEGNSRNFRRLSTWYGNYVCDYGFPYLNSDHNCKMQSEIYADMQSTVREINSARMSEIYDLWRKTNDLRDIEMLTNIQKYCSENTFERGVFIVGAAHRRSIIEKSQTTTAIQWSFSDI